MNHHSITLLERKYRKLKNGHAQVQLGEHTFTVADHPFWEKFAQGWEPDTEKTYRQAVTPGSCVIDIGAWIGPTVMFALAFGAEKIIALEPNPQSFQSLQQLIELNPSIAKNVVALNLAISGDGQALTMGLTPGEDDTSTFGISGDAITINTITINDLLHAQNIAQPDLIKIDIEGAEALLSDQLQLLSQLKNTKIHLSLHVPLFPKSYQRTDFIEAFKGFDLYDDRGDAITHATLAERITATQKHPRWGTKHGNYFELILHPK